jgi:hypothetical protein
MKQLTALVSILHTGHCVAGVFAGGDAKSYSISSGSASNSHPVGERSSTGTLSAFQLIICSSNMQPRAARRLGNTHE